MAEERGSETGRRGRMDPGRGRLALAVFMVVLGSFMPWLSTGVGSISGARGPGLWTFYSALIGLGGVFLPWLRVAGVQALVMAAVCVLLPVWQLVRALRLLGWGGWAPGPGILLVLGGGVLAAVAGLQLLRERSRRG